MNDAAVYGAIDACCASIPNNMVRMRTVIVAQKLYRLCRKLGRWWLRITQPVLARLCGVSVSTLYDALKLLASIKVLKVERKKAPSPIGGVRFVENEYRFHGEFLAGFEGSDRSVTVKEQVNPGLFSFRRKAAYEGKKATSWHAQVEPDRVKAEVAALWGRYAPHGAEKERRRERLE